jgi:hypothetical protein
MLEKMNQSPEVADRQFPMAESAWNRLRSSAAALCVKVTRDGERMFMQHPGSEPEEFVCNTLRSAGFIQCARPSLGKPCEADTQYHLRGRRLVCKACGRVSDRLPLVVLNQFENWAHS